MDIQGMFTSSRAPLTCPLSHLLSASSSSTSSTPTLGTLLGRLAYRIACLSTAMCVSSLQHLQFSMRQVTHQVREGCIVSASTPYGHGEVVGPIVIVCLSLMTKVSQASVVCMSPMFTCSFLSRLCRLLFHVPWLHGSRRLQISQMQTLACG